MAYRLYSTRNADYAQAYCFHDKVTDEDIFSKNKIKDLDAIVLESGRILNPMQVIFYRQYSNIEETIRKYSPKIPIYITDVAPIKRFQKDWFEQFASVSRTVGVIGAGTSLILYGLARKKVANISRRTFLGLSFGSLGLVTTVNLPFFSTYYLATNKGEVGGLLPEIVKIRYHNISKSRLVTLRDAITARKIEEYIVPKLRDETGRMPRIGIVYGAAHAGIEGCLKDKNQRDEIIQEFSEEGFELLIPDQINAVVQMQYLDKEWKFKVDSCGLF